MITNGAVKALSNQLQSGIIDRREFAIRLKRLYDQAGTTFDEETLGYVEGKFKELDIPFAKPEITDGVVKQAVSGLLEGFTTFGFADEPDTPTEKIINNVGHLIGLAPGVMAGGLRMITGATKTVGQSLVRRGIAEKNKNLVKTGKKLEAQSRNWKLKNKKLNYGLAKVANTLSKTDADDKLVYGLRGSRAVGMDPIKDGKALYELKSIPGKLAEVVQEQGLAFLGDNKDKAMQFITKGLLRNKMGEEAVSRILYEAGHVGLLMAFSNHPLASRNEAGLTVDGVKNMAKAGMHGAIAGGIFGSIGEYGNIGKLLASKNPSVRKFGEDAVRKTARSLSRKENDVEVFNLINTLTRGTMGAGYGGVSSAINDLPMEEVVYETLMGVFFSVNGRSSWENRATKSIVERAPELERTLSMDKAKAHVRKQPWFKDESPEFQMYWDRYLESIRVQQIESIFEVKAEVDLEYAKAFNRAVKEGLVTQEQIQEILRTKGEQEGKLEAIKYIAEQEAKKIDPNYSPSDVKRSAYNPKYFINLEPLTVRDNFRDQNSTTTNETELPMGSLSQIVDKIKTQANINTESAHKGIRTIYNEVKNEAPDNRIDADKFVEKIRLQFGDSVVKGQEQTLKSQAHAFDQIKPSKDSHIISLIGNKNNKQKNIKVPKGPYPTPETDPQGNIVTREGSGVRDTYKGFNTMWGYSIDYIEVVGERSVPQKDGTYKNIIDAQYVSPNSKYQKGVFKKGKFTGFEVEANVTELQWLNLEKNLNKKGQFIYGTIGDTGRIDVRTLPWSTKGRTDKAIVQDPLLSGQQVTRIYNSLMGGGTSKFKNSLDLKNPLNSLSVKNNSVATYIYRLRDLGLIKSNKDINYTNLIGLKKQWLAAEKQGGFVDPSKQQKYLNQRDKPEIPFLDGVEYGFADNNFKAILIEDPVYKRILDKKEVLYESGVDGTFILDADFYDATMLRLGGVLKSGTAKGTVYSNPDGTRGVVIGKFAYVRADKEDTAYMKSHADNPKAIMYTSAAKHAPRVPINKMSQDKLTGEMSYPSEAKTFNLSTQDLYLNPHVYESMKPSNSDHSQNIMQQMFLNINDVQFDPKTPEGKKFHDSWKTLIRENVNGDTLQTERANKRINDNKDLSGIDIDKISMTTLSKLLSTNIQSKAAADVIKHLFYKDKTQQTIDMEMLESDKISSLHVGEHLASTDFSYTTLMSRGTSEFVQKSWRNYAFSRIVRPRVENTYKTILGPYDYKVASRKQKYSTEKKGLGDKEFMLWEGAGNFMRMKDPSNPKKYIKLKDWWKTMSKILEGDQKTIASLSGKGEYQRWIDSQYALINRSPVLTSGNMRALKFVGWVKGKNGTGSMLITNGRNDMYMGGADKDIDSAHLSWGMPKDIVKGYRQDKVRFEMSEKIDRNNPQLSPDKELKDRKVNQYWTKAKYIDKNDASNPFKMLLLGHKQQAGIAATYGKDSIGQLFNGFMKAKLALNLAIQRNPKMSKKEAEALWQEMIVETASISNQYIDAAEVSYIDPAPWVVERFSERWAKDYNAKQSATYSNYHQAAFRGILPEGKTYKQLSNDVIKEHGSANSIFKTMAEHSKNWNLDIDPFVGIEKRDILNTMRKLSKMIENDPFGQELFSIRDMNKDLLRDMTKQEQDVIMENPHFLYNKMHPIRVAKAIMESNRFVEDLVGDFEKYGIYKREDLNNFVAEVAHIAQQQKADTVRYRKNKSIKDPLAQMSYAEKVYHSKEMLKTQLDEYFDSGRFAKGKKSVPQKAKQEIYRRIEQLFEYWHEAHPHMAEISFTNMTDSQKTYHENVQRKYKNKLRERRNIVDFVGGKKGNPRPDQDKLDMSSWRGKQGDRDRNKYNNLTSELEAFGFERRNYIEKHSRDNMNRNGAISKEVKLDIAKFEQDVLRANQQKVVEATETMLKNQTEPYLQPVENFSEMYGKKVNPKMEDVGKFIKESLFDWEAVSQSQDIQKELQKQIAKKEKITSKYKVHSEFLDSELRRFQGNIYQMIKSGNIAGAMDVSSQYTGGFKALDIAAKVTTETIDYNHLRILNNMFENRYLMTHKEWAARKLIHKDLVKEMEDLQLDPDSQLLPPDWAIDLLFPSELGKIMAKHENLFRVDKAQVLENGKFKEYGVRMPASTIELIGEKIGIKHEAANALRKAMEQEYNGYLDGIRTDNPKVYNKYKDIISAVAAYERQLGIEKDGAWDGTGPRVNEHQRSLDNLERNLIQSRKALESIPEGTVFRIKDRGTGDTVDMTSRDLVNYVKKEIFEPFASSVYKDMYESNYAEMEKVLNRKTIKKGKFGGMFNYDKFYGDRVRKEDANYWEKSLSEMFLSKEGWIDRERVLFLDEYNVLNKDLKEGKNVIKRQPHIDDINWINLQLDLLDTLEMNYGTVMKNGRIGLDPVALKKAGQFKEVQKIIKETNKRQLRSLKTGKIGAQEVDGVLFSKRYWPLMGQDSTKAGVKRIMEEHIPAETIRIFGNKREDGTFDYKQGITLAEIRQESPRLAQQVTEGFLTLQDARAVLYKRMINTLVKDPQRYNNELHDPAVERELSKLSSRRNSSASERIGIGVPTHGRTRTAVPVEGYDVTFDALKNYALKTSDGITQQLAALQSRLLLTNFKNGVHGNKHIEREHGEKWLNKMIDMTKGYMGYQSTRDLDINGVTAKEMDILKDYQKSGFSDSFIVDKRLGTIEAKLIKDFDQWTMPSDTEINAMQRDIRFKSDYTVKKAIFRNDRKNIRKNKKLTKEEKAEQVKALENDYFRDLNRKQRNDRHKLYGKFTDIKTRKEIYNNEIQYVDWANSTVTKTNGTVRKVKISDGGLGKQGMVRTLELQYKKEFIESVDSKGKPANVDKINMRKSFRSWYSDETVGNVMLKFDNVANKALGYVTGNRIQIFKDLPTDPQARHKGMVSKLNWLSDMEGKFEMMSLLAHPKSAVANLYGGTLNTITDTGFKHYFESFSEDKLVNVHFKGVKFNRWDPTKKEWESITIKNKRHIHQYFESYGFLENNITMELAMMRPPGETRWQEFAKETGEIIQRKFAKLPIYTKDKELNRANELEREAVVERTFMESAKDKGITKKFLDLGSLAMRSTERHLRIKSAISHYLKAKELYTDSRGKVEVSEEFLLDYAKKGIAASQFIYHATNRPNFANTAFGRMMTRFHPYGWNSIRRRANIINDYMLTEGYGNFEANKRFERQMSADLMVSALSVVFAASLFEYALSPPMNWAVDFSHLMFGDDQERERAFYNQYGHPALAPLGIVTPPIARFGLTPMVGLINNDFENFWKYTFATAFPFGRLGRDVVRSLETPEMWMEYTLGIPVHTFGRLGDDKRPKEDEIEE